jgi:hypothetical protein
MFSPNTNFLKKLKIFSSAFLLFLIFVVNNKSHHENPVF